MRVRISHVIIALAALVIGFLLGLPHARAQTVDESVGRGTVQDVIPTGAPVSGARMMRFDDTPSNLPGAADRPGGRHGGNPASPLTA